MNHPAILKSQEIYDSERDELLPHEAALIRSVNRACDQRTNSYVAAQIVWGDLPKMYRSCLLAADEHYAVVMMRALDAYNEARELVS
jgi:hypothetical protein